ncbi:MAG: hypothetical protein AAFX00_07070 [Pseudomonadota bacterium]
MSQMTGPGLAVIAVMTASMASGQDTLYERNALGNVTNIEKQIARLLLDNGVSEDCVGQLKLIDISVINGILNSAGTPAPQKRSQVKAVLDRSCS